MTAIIAITVIICIGGLGVARFGLEIYDYYSESENERGGTNGN